MRNPAYLTLSEQGIYHFRWPIPKHLLGNGKRRYCKLSLGTREPKRALFLAKRLVNAAEQLVLSGRLQGMDYATMKNAVQVYLQGSLQHTKEMLEWKGPQHGIDQQYLKQMRVLAQAADEGLFRTLPPEAEEECSNPEMVRHIIEKLDLGVTQNDPEWRYLEVAVNNALPAFSQQYVKLVDSCLYDFNFENKEQLQQPLLAITSTAEAQIRRSILHVCRFGYRLKPVLLLSVSKGWLCAL